MTIAISISFSWALYNLFRVDHQGWVNNISAIYIILSTIVIIVTILLVTPSKSSNAFVWTQFNNDTGINNSSYICIMGILFSAYSFTGYEAGAHMAEETTKASESAPKGILYTCILTAVTGFVYILGLLYAIQDNIAFITSDQASDQAVVSVFYLAFTNSEGVTNKAGVLAMTTLLLINCFFAGFSSLTVTSRIGFAMARDNAFPYSEKLRFVHPKNKTPVAMIFLVFMIDTLFCLLPLISVTAFDAITSITTIGFEISYMIPIFLRITFARKSFKTSDFSLGAFSTPCGILSVIYLVFTSVIFMFPTQFNSEGKLSADVFNYTPVVVALVLIIAAIYWWLPKPYGARHFFEGPKRKEEEDLGLFSGEGTPKSV